MSWLNPGDYAQDLLNSERPDVLELAKYTSLCPRIEPLLLRNMRLKFLSGSEPELEYQLWFSRIVAARSTRNIVLDQAAARLLADELKENQDLFLEVWHDTQAYTVHWLALDKLEQQLRYESLLNNQPAINKGLQKILRHISRTQDEEALLNFARWAKRTLPAISSETASNETALLAQYAATALGATAAWTELSSTEPLPVWLAKALPGPSSTFAHGKIGLQLRYDPDSNEQVLECLPPEESGNVLDMPTPLPARLYIQCENETTGRWLVIDSGSRIKLPRVSRSIELRTIDGKAYQLIAEFEPGSPPEPNSKHLNLYLTHVREDTGIASKIAKDLERQQISVTLIEEKPGETALETVHDLNARLLRLWTPTAQSQWATVKLEPSLTSGNSLLLRMGQVELPLGTQPAQVINLDETQNLMPAIQRWLEDINKPVNSVTREEEIEELLKELENPETRPRRRLEIGGRLAEMGDPRKGVGVKEYEIIEYAPEIQRLLDELDDIKTEPPRRLEIGNQLAELGDPRPGVGLDDNGLPDIDWVEIPEGPFIYGENRQTIDLPGYYISRYPITNSQYQAFIDAGGYNDERWWQGLKRPEPRVPTWKQTNRPRESVDWYEALAFTRWLTDQLEFTITLPNEVEWEKAARGSDGRVYPWGDEFRSGYANIDETYDEKKGPYYLQETTAVGLYPQGQSPYHVDDMVGNVWEWCLNKYSHPEQTTPDQSGDDRVLRGGSWHNDPGYARASRRLGLNPGLCNSNLGFRVVCSSPYTDH